MPAIHPHTEQTVGRALLSPVTGPDRPRRGRRRRVMRLLTVGLVVLLAGVFAMSALAQPTTPPPTAAPSAMPSEPCVGPGPWAATCLTRPLPTPSLIKKKHPTTPN
jgi:hypothetical protein